MSENKGIIGDHLSPEENQVVNTAIENLENAINGKLKALTKEERQTYGSINEKNKLLVEKVNERTVTAPQFKPDEVDWDEFKADYNSRINLNAWIARLQSIVYRMESTKILHDYDNYRNSLSYYGYMYYQKKMGVPGAAEIYDELSQFFIRAPHKTKEG